MMAEASVTPPRGAGAVQKSRWGCCGICASCWLHPADVERQWRVYTSPPAAAAKPAVLQQLPHLIVLLLHRPHLPLAGAGGAGLQQQREGPRLGLGQRFIS